MLQTIIHHRFYSRRRERGRGRNANVVYRVECNPTAFATIPRSELTFVRASRPQPRSPRHHKDHDVHAYEHRRGNMRDWAVYPLIWRFLSYAVGLVLHPKRRKKRPPTPSPSLYLTTPHLNPHTTTARPYGRRGRSSTPRTSPGGLFSCEPTEPFVSPSPALCPPLLFPPYGTAAAAASPLSAAPVPVTGRAATAITHAPVSTLCEV